MEVILDPPDGVAPVLIGMPLDAALEAASVWGQVQQLNRPNRAPKAVVSNPDFEVVLHFEEADSVTAVEVWRFRDESADVRVLYKGVDVFRTPARALLRSLQEGGQEVRDAKGEYPSAPGLTLGFTREAAHPVPLDKDRLPLHFEAVLVADASYYD